MLSYMANYRVVIFNQFSVFGLGFALVTVSVRIVTGSICNVIAVCNSMEVLMAH